MIDRQNSPYRNCRKALDSNGATILKGFFEPQEIVTLQQDIMTIFQVETKDQLHQVALSKSKSDTTELYMLYQCIARSLALQSLSCKLGQFTQTVLATGPVMNLDSNVLFGLPNDKRLAHEWHQEAPYYPGLHNEVLTFWFPVMEHSSQEIGTMSVLKDSHKQGLLPYCLYQKVNGFTELVPKNIRKLEETLPESPCILNLGDVLLFHQHTIHRSNWNETTRTRFSGSVRFASHTIKPERISNYSEVYENMNSAKT